MLGIDNSKNRFIPANNDEANGEIIGRANAVHDYLYALALENRTKQYYEFPLERDLRTVCTLMGFTDVLRIEMAPKEEQV